MEEIQPLLDDYQAVLSKLLQIDEFSEDQRISIIEQLHSIWQDSNAQILLQAIEGNQLDPYLFAEIIGKLFGRAELRRGILSLLLNIPLRVLPDAAMNTLVDSILPLCHRYIEISEDSQMQIDTCRLLEKLIREADRVQDILNESFPSIFIGTLSSFLSSENSTLISEQAESFYLPPVEREMLEVLISLIGKEAAYYHIASLVNQGVLSVFSQVILRPAMDVHTKLKLLEVFRQMVSVAVRSHQQDRGVLMTQLTNLGVPTILSQLKQQELNRGNDYNPEILQTAQEILDIANYAALINQHPTSAKKSAFR